MTLNNHYKNAALIPSILVIIGYIIFSIIDNLSKKEYKSEYFSEADIVIISLIMVSFNAIFICVLSTTLLLNKYDKVKNNFIISATSWFLLPMIWIGYLFIGYIKSLLIGSNDSLEESVFMFSNTFPYLIGLCFTFIKFRLDINKRNE